MTTRVVDCFHFNDELDLLETRLRLLAPVVDQFVIVEADRTFTGVPKPLGYAENRLRFEGYADKILPLVADLSADTSNPWDREDRQRQRMREFVEGLSDDHVCLIGDVDEFPYPDTVRALRHGCTVPLRLGMHHSIYFANWQLPHEFELGTMAFRPSQRDHQMVRALLGDRHDDWTGYVEDYVPAAGRHLSFLGGADAIRQKLSAYSHQEYDDDRYRGAGHLEQVIRRGIHLDGVFEVRRLPPEEFDEVITAAAEQNEDLVNLTRAPARLRRDAYRLATRLRTTDRARPLTTIASGRAWVVDALSPLLAPMQRLIDARRQGSPMPRRTAQRRVTVADLAARSTPSS